MNIAIYRSQRQRRQHPAAPPGRPGRHPRRRLCPIGTGSGRPARSPRISPRVIDYDDREGLASALTGAGWVVHLAGILMESPTSSYRDGQRRRHPRGRGGLQGGWSSSHRARQRSRRGPRLGQSVPALEGPGGAHRRRLGPLGRHHSHADPAGPWYGRGPRRRPRSVTADGHAARRRASLDPAAGCGRPEPGHPSAVVEPRVPVRPSTNWPGRSP